MAILFKTFKKRIFNSGPVLFLYYLSISDIDAQFSNTFEILSFNIQLIIIYYWKLKRNFFLGNGHIFMAGIINDVVMGLPLGISALTYLIVSLVASYIKNVTVNISLFTDWFTFLIAIFFSNLFFLILIYNFTNFQITYTEIFYNSFFTMLFYPFFWVIFNFYKSFMLVKNDD